ncbi:hypothetical protein PG993_007905 [Apiospora rasikravindrae]|uniref:Uncharacterized protein n=1 Tax=Apiospora rasikravindrae TaxID=990691 RepID=A0ABR1SYU1_9PEZI
MDFSDLKDTLKTMHPGVAQRRLKDLQSNTALLNAMPFNGNHAGALCDVLQCIARKETSGYRNNMSLLEKCARKPSNITETMATFLDAETPISNEELIQTICFLSSKDKIQTLKKEALTSYEGQSFYDDLKKLYEPKDISSTKLRKLVDKSIDDIEPHDREVIYFHLTSGSLAPTLLSDIDRIAKRCDVDIVKQILDELPAHWETPGSPVEHLMAMLKSTPSRQGGESRKVHKHTADLGWHLRLISAQDAQTLVAAVDRASARLAIMPRHVARNYTTALQQLDSDDHDDYEKAKIVNTAIYENCARGGKALKKIVKEVERACRDDEAAPRHRKLPRGLLEASVDDLVDIHNALIEYLKEEGHDYEGSCVARREL